MKKNIIKYSLFIVAMLIMSLGIDLLIKASFGVAPWDVLHTGLTNYLPFSLGQIIIGIGFVLVLIAYALGVKPTFATIFNMILIGYFYDIIVAYNIISSPQTSWLQALYFLGGLNCFGFGTALYISLNLGTGPRDSLMMAVSKLTSLRLGLVRTLMEVLAVVIGFLLGGLVGVGTLLFSITIGWIMEMYFYMLKKINYINTLNVQQINHSREG